MREQISVVSAEPVVSIASVEPANLTVVDTTAAPWERATGARERWLPPFGHVCRWLRAGPPTPAVAGVDQLVGRFLDQSIDGDERRTYVLAEFTNGVRNTGS
ncbi:hypothetical protein [Streptomyces sp. NPDC001492]